NEHGFDVVDSENSTVFTDDELEKYRVIVFLNTTGDILDARQQEAFERFIRRGGGFVGIHSASDTEYDWSWYGQLVGTYFSDHPPIQPAIVKVIDPAHLSTQVLPSQWLRTDEWYNFRGDPTNGVHVLLVVDEASY